MLEVWILVHTCEALTLAQVLQRLDLPPQEYQQCISCKTAGMQSAHSATVRLTQCCPSLHCLTWADGAASLPLRWQFCLLSSVLLVHSCTGTFICMCAVCMCVRGPPSIQAVSDVILRISMRKPIANFIPNTVRTSLPNPSTCSGAGSRDVCPVLV